MDRAEGIPLDLINERTPFFDALDILDTACNDYYLSCAAFARKPFNKFIAPIEQNIEKQMDAFSGVLSALGENAVAAEVTAVAAHLIVSKSSDRADYLNRFMRGQHLTPLKAGSVTIEDTAADESIPEASNKHIIENCTLAYLNSVDKDTTEFSFFIASTKAGRRADKINGLKTHALEIGKHSLDASKDVGKIAVGTALGLLIARAVSRKD